ncbi:hypothetical protein, partial [Rubripirellula obstinata]|uniref:hypothetical protein n=1 Tax=Rubripirellula obstinata TaxID=406547 RepID=UPI001EE438FE
MKVTHRDEVCAVGPYRDGALRISRNCASRPRFGRALRIGFSLEVVVFDGSMAALHAFWRWFS